MPVACTPRSTNSWSAASLSGNRAFGGRAIGESIDPAPSSTSHAPGDDRGVMGGADPGGGDEGAPAPAPPAAGAAPARGLPGAAGYVASLPERLLRAAAGVVGGVLKEGGELLLPPPVRCSTFYEGFLGGLQRWLIRDLGGVEGVVAADAAGDGGFARRTVGNVIDAGALLALHASPLLVIGVAADLAKGGQVVLAELVGDLKREGLVAAGAGDSLDAVLDGVHGVAAKLAQQLQVPPLSRGELAAVAGDLRARLETLAAGSAIEAAEVAGLLADLRGAAREQRRPLWDVAAAVAQAIAVAAGTGARVARERVLAPWRDQFARLRREGFVAYWSATSAPYLAALARHLHPDQPTLTERWLAAGIGWIGRRRPTCGQPGEDYAPDDAADGRPAG
jgi:hypothetical protein